MSEDVELKIVPNEVFHTLTSRSDKKKARKAIRLSVEKAFRAFKVLVNEVFEFID